jgi:hypothetical protein
VYEGRKLRFAACALVIIVLFYCEQELKKRWHHCPLLHTVFFQPQVHVAANGLPSLHAAILCLCPFA